jgi:two-component system, OmpR family, alkaline phosphatase synthesis response regulator PhoP
MKDEAGGFKVLIIDDEPEVANLVKFILTRKCSDEVYIASSASAGLKIARQERPDLIIVRIMMYEMNGYEVCRQLKAMLRLQDTPVLLQAAMDPKRVYPEAQRVGAAGYLCQPYHPQEVIAARDAVLRGDVYYPPLPEDNDSQ